MPRHPSPESCCIKGMATAEHTLEDTLRPPAGTGVRSIGLDSSNRVARFVAVFRVVVAVLMVLAGSGFQGPPILGQRAPELFIITSSFYLGFAMAALAWQWRGPRMGSPVLAGQLAADIAAITVLMHASGGITSGIGALLVVFVGAACLMLQGRYALLAAAVASLAVLAEQVASSLWLGTPPGEFIAAGLLGAIIFLIATATIPLARRLEESEALARQRGIDLANLAQLNEYIIRNLRESIVVVDGEDRIRLMNQSAAEHLGIPDGSAGERLSAQAPKLARILSDWRRQGNSLLQPPPFLSADGSTRINAYLAPLEGRSDGPVLMFLEDAGILSQKVQQSKLAALGRLSASIAHEIRNPVGALSHASQLLEESPGIGPDEQRLLDIIRTNSRRVSDIVDSILQLSRRETSRPALIYLADWAREFTAEFTATLELFEGQLTVTSTEDVAVRMDPGHLRQIAWNLCENAVKYASEAAGGIAVEIAFGRLPGSRRPYLEVADRGPGVPEELREQIFEPFATGRPGSTGLGLFISRELCECNQAALLYESRPGGGSLFRVVFADPGRWGS